MGSFLLKLKSTDQTYHDSYPERLNDQYAQNSSPIIIYNNDVQI